MLLVVNRKTIKYPELTQVENAVDAIVVAELGAHQVSRNVKND